MNVDKNLIRHWAFLVESGKTGLESDMNEELEYSDETLNKFMQDLFLNKNNMYFAFYTYDGDDKKGIKLFPMGEQNGDIYFGADITHLTYKTRQVYPYNNFHYLGDIIKNLVDKKPAYLILDQDFFGKKSPTQLNLAKIEKDDSGYILYLACKADFEFSGLVDQISKIQLNIWKKFEKLNALSSFSRERVDKQTARLMGFEYNEKYQEKANEAWDKIKDQTNG